ncbi:MAG TPA: DUF882 domain-containing protein [Polyangiaceae bacterium]|nr:DUF882 domain-containing protein [Polyangiaceae bacterium]
MGQRAKAVLLLIASASASTFAAQPALPEARVPHGGGLATKKGAPADAESAPPLLSTLDQVHTGEHVALDAELPTQQRFDALLADRVTGATHAVDERLLGLLRALAAKHPGGRIELVSGYRSPKLNEMLRKKGHHVSSHSQHSLGLACDFRIVPGGESVALDPRLVEREIRALGWDGGVGVYPTKDDWFVHADVGRNRRWVN